MFIYPKTNHQTNWGETKAECRILFSWTLETLLKDYARRYATGDEVFLADLFLHPQLDAAIKMFKVEMTQFPLLSRLNEAYNEIPAFQDAMPDALPASTC